MAIYLVRHGETAWSLHHRHTGSTDIPLNARGEEQAKELGPRLAGVEFSQVLASPMRRARETAELAGVQPTPEITPLLREFDYGEYEGVTSEEIERARPGWDLWRDGCPGGESPQQEVCRCRRLLVRLDPKSDRDYALFGHGHALRAVAAAYLGVPVDLCRHLTLQVASISILSQEHDIPAIEAWDLT
ncbi:MAG TPA: histidine phosphatase family protein [Candidatus Saccharimonadales bacterium]|nr:histidine phosphatase family protein [Candidatus Saccharimonadales bacterium]